MQSCSQAQGYYFSGGNSLGTRLHALSCITTALWRDSSQRGTNILRMPLFYLLHTVWLVRHLTE